MSRATGLLNRVDAVMRKFAPLTLPCYKRVITRTGGNDLIGRASSVTHVDTLFDPQPVFEQMGRRTLVGGRNRVEPLMTTDGRRTADEYKFIFSPTAFPLASIEIKDTLLVFKDTSGNDVDVLEILDFDPEGMNSTIVIITLYARSIKR